MANNSKPRFLYYVHAHGYGHLATFNLLYPALSRHFEVVALTTNSIATNALKTYADLKVVEISPKWPATIPAPEHTFSKAFEETPYLYAPSERIADLLNVVQTYRPVAFYCDGSPELAIAARAMGVPVVLVHLPGDVMKDPTQVFAYELADHIVAHFPAKLSPSDYLYAGKTLFSGFMSRYSNDGARHSTESGNRVTVLLGSDAFDEAILARITKDPSRTYTIIGGGQAHELGPNTRQTGRVIDIASAIDGDIIITAAGQNTVAELISLNKKLILLPQPRPYDEQAYAAAALANHSLALTADHDFSASQWQAVITDAGLAKPNYDGLVNPHAPDLIASKLMEWYG